MAQCKSLLTAICSAVAISASLLAVPLAAQAADNQRARVIVSYAGGSSAAVRAAVARLGGRVVVDLDELEAVAVTLPRSAVAALRASPGVEFVEEDVVRTVLGARSVDNARPTVLSTQVVPYGITMVQADQISGTGSWTPKICIVDSGIDATHEDLAGNMLSGVNYSGSGTWDTDELHHGTHVAGTIAALDNSIGVVGVAGRKQLKLYISKVFDATGSASSSIVAKGIMGCKRARANVVTMSLGGPSPSRIEQRAVDRVFAAGAMVIAAAGNAGTSAISYPAGFVNVMSVAAVDENMAWATFSQFNTDVEISGPGVNVLSTVPMGTGRDASLSVGVSNYQANPMDGAPVSTASAPLYDFGTGEVDDPGVAGKVCLIARGNIAFSDKVTRCQTNGGVGAVIYNNAPGNFFGTLSGVVTAIPSMSVAQADGVTLLGQLGQTANLALLATNYAIFSGTSMATPHVSGVASLVWSYYPQCTNEQIRSTLKLSALDIGDPGYDVKTGFGLVQARAAFDRIATLGCGN